VAGQAQEPGNKTHRTLFKRPCSKGPCFSRLVRQRETGGVISCSCCTALRQPVRPEQAGEGAFSWVRGTIWSTKPVLEQILRRSGNPREFSRRVLPRINTGGRAKPIRALGSAGSGRRSMRSCVTPPGGGVGDQGDVGSSAVAVPRSAPEISPFACRLSKSPPPMRHRRRRQTSTTGRPRSVGRLNHRSSFSPTTDPIRAAHEKRKSITPSARGLSIQPRKIHNNRNLSGRAGPGCEDPIGK